MGDGTERMHLTTHVVPQPRTGALARSTVVQSAAQSARVDEVMERVQTGDIVLFQGDGAISGVIKVALHTVYSHVGMVMRIAEPLAPARMRALLEYSALPAGAPAHWRQLYMVHAVNFTRCNSRRYTDARQRGKLVLGVQCNLLYDMLVRYNGTVLVRFMQLYASPRVAADDVRIQARGAEQQRVLDACALRDASRTQTRPRRAATLLQLVDQVCGANYEQNPWRLALLTAPRVQRVFLSAANSTGLDSFYCSELVAILLSFQPAAGLSLERTPAELYAPHAFASDAFAEPDVRKSLFRVRAPAPTMTARQRGTALATHGRAAEVVVLAPWHSSGGIIF